MSARARPTIASTQSGLSTKACRNSSIAADACSWRLMSLISARAPHRQVERVPVVFRRAPPGPTIYHLNSHAPRQAGNNLVLHLQQLAARFIKGLGPQMLVRFGVDQ